MRYNIGNASMGRKYLPADLSLGGQKSLDIFFFFSFRSRDFSRKRFPPLTSKVNRFQLGIEFLPELWLLLCMKLCSWVSVAVLGSVCRVWEEETRLTTIALLARQTKKSTKYVQTGKH